jgi:hypothetical protein
MHNLESQFIGVQKFLRKFLQRQQLIRAQIALVVRRPLARQDWFSQIFRTRHRKLLIAESKIDNRKFL